MRPEHPRALPMDSRESIGDILLQPVSRLALTPPNPRPPPAITRSQRYAIAHSQRDHLGVGAKSGLTYEARQKANRPEVYPHDPLDVRPHRQPTLNQRHAIAASRIPEVHTYHKVKAKIAGREKAAVPLPFAKLDATTIRPSKIQPHLHKSYT